MRFVTTEVTNGQIGWIRTQWSDTFEDYIKSEKESMVSAETDLLIYKNKEGNFYSMLWVDSLEQYDDAGSGAVRCHEYIITETHPFFNIDVLARVIYDLSNRHSTGSLEPLAKVAFSDATKVMNRNKDLKLIETVKGGRNED